MGMDSGFAAMGGGQGIFLPFTPALLNMLGGEEGLKALTAESGSNAINTMGFVPEDLEIQAHATLWSRDDLHFVREVPTVNAQSIFHEFEIVDEYGNIHTPAFQAEGGLGPQDAFHGQRKIVRIVTFSRVNKVTGLARAQKTVRAQGSTDVLESNRQAQLNLLLMQKAMHMVYGEAGASSSALRWKGLIEQFVEANAAAAFAANYKSVDSELMVDMRGAPLTRSVVEAASTSMFVNGWGQFNRLYMDPPTSQGFQGEIETNFPMERVTAGGTPDSFIIGSPVAGVRAQGGVVTFKVDNSLHPRFFFSEPYEEATLAGKVLSPATGAPAKPAAAPVVVTAGGVATSKWQAADIPVAPADYYKVQPVNDYGMGPPSDASDVVTSVAGGSNTLTWNTSADALSYRVLRINRADNRYYQIAELKSDAAQLSHVDLNQWLPGGRVAIGVEMLYPKSAQNRLSARAQDNAVRWAVLEGLKTKPLAPIGDFYWELILERCAPELVQSKRMRVFYNIGNR